jgi:hypothetical protein
VPTAISSFKTTDWLISADAGISSFASVIIAGSGVSEAVEYRGLDAIANIKKHIDIDNTTIIPISIALIVVFFTYKPSFITYT